jgi:hypothetical protein
MQEYFVVIQIFPERPVILATMPTKKPVNISTIADLGRNNMTLGLYCPECRRWAEIIPAVWLKTHADVSYVGRAFRCKDCGARADKQVRPPT